MSVLHQCWFYLCLCLSTWICCGLSFHSSFMDMECTYTGASRLTSCMPTIPSSIPPINTSVTMLCQSSRSPTTLVSSSRFGTNLLVACTTRLASVQAVPEPKGREHQSSGPRSRSLITLFFFPHLSGGKLLHSPYTPRALPRLSK